MTDIQRWRVLLIGAGAVGSIQAGMLAYLRQMSLNAGATEPVPIVHWVVRNAQMRTILNKTGLSFKHFDGSNSKLPSVNIQNMMIVDSLEAVPDLNFDLVIIAVKSFQIEPIVQYVKHNVKHNNVLLLCNGWQLIKECYWGLVFGGSYFNGNKLLHSQTYKITIGSLYSEQIIDTKLLDRLNNDAIQINTSASFVIEALTKLAINSVINPIAALVGVNNGCLAEKPISVLTNAVIDEVSSVYKCLDIPGMSDINIRHEVEKVLIHSGSNYCSMYQDFSLGRTSELHDILGTVLNWSIQTQVPAPHLSWLYHTLNAAQTTNALKKLAL